MQVFRLTRKKYANTLSGQGAAKAGNRWNSKGVEMIYSANSRALAMAEVAVHLTLATLPRNFVMMEVHIPDYVAIEKLSISPLPKGWNKHPPISATQHIGNQFIAEQKNLVLQVPSAVVPGDCNYLINPFHSDFSKIQIGDVQEFPWDERLFR